jgi:hypothetical protein
MSLALRLTLVLLLLRPIASGWLRPSILALAAAGLVWPRALHHPVLWLALAALTSWRVLEGWPLGDNHAYLLVYWCLAIALARLAPEPGSARWRGTAARWSASPSRSRRSPSWRRRTTSTDGSSA